MKKTIIAIAIAAGATLSTSAFALEWQPGTANGEVGFGGTITPNVVQSPWKVKLGSGVNNLDSQVDSGVDSVSMNMPTDALILGIRSDGFFQGGPNLAPKIDYSGHMGNDFQNGKVSLTLDVTDDAGQSIGTLTTKMTTAAMGASKTPSAEGHYFMWADGANSAYAGGLADSVDKAMGDSVAFAQRIDSTITENWERPGRYLGGFPSRFHDTTAQYNSYYVSALESSETVSIQLKNPLTSAVTWKASLPITVTYQ
ncbi:hypothetical protein ACCO07_004745 [Escherichia coli]